MTNPDLAFIIEAWPLLGPQAKSQMITMAHAAGLEKQPCGAGWVHVGDGEGREP